MSKKKATKFAFTFIDKLIFFPTIFNTLIFTF
jgi:hypothetical protein